MAGRDRDLNFGQRVGSYDKNSLVHKSALPDSPISSVEDDLLDRAGFSDNIASLILKAPKGSTLRIGVYGEWGEGKTSVLRMIRQRIRAKEHACIWLVPWMAESKEEIAALLMREIVTELGIEFSVLKRSERWDKIAKGARSLVDIDVKTKVADAVFGPALADILGKKKKLATNAMLEQISAKLGNRKLVVFVDDLDRVRPDLVPNLLLTLREALDRPDFFYILGLDPNVVERGLKAVHNSWGDPRRFLEKIIELPCYLPPLSETNRKKFLDQLIAEGSESVHAKALRDIASQLPSNPRRLKLFVRYVMSLAGVACRFGPEEFDWRAFYLAQLLRLEFPEEVRKLVRETEIMNDIVYRAFSDRTKSLAGLGNSVKDQKENRPEDACIAAEHPGKNRFLQLCEAIREQGFLAWGRYGIEALLRIPEDIPIFTYAEVVKIVDTWLDEENTEYADELFAEEIRKASNKGVESIRSLWRMLLEIRENHISATVDKVLDTELREGLMTAGRLVDLLQHIAVGPFGFKSVFLGEQEWRGLFKHCRRWAHFSKLEAYVDIRFRERELLRETFLILSGEALEDLMDLFSNEDLLDPIPNNEFGKLFEELHAYAIEIIVPRTLKLFEELEGLEAVWGESKRPACKILLFSAISPIYKNEKYRRSLLELCIAAHDNAVIQKNMVLFLRQLLYGATTGGSFLRTECKAILSDSEVAQAVWTASLTRPLNPRITGSIREGRDAAIQDGIPIQHMPIPEWWARLESAGFFKTPAQVTNPVEHKEPI